ncbi:MAG: sugar phosphate isomerase/epimerase family protein [bacterium]
MKTNRRTFIGTAVALAAAHQAPYALPRNAPGDLRLGVASYSLRKFSRKDAIEIIQELEVSCVSIKSFHLPYQISPDELAAGSQEFRDAGLEVLSGGNIDLTEPSELRKMFEYAKYAGLPMMVCAPSHQTLDQVERLVQEFDIKIAIHNHGPEDDHFPTPRVALEALENRDRRMGLCVDVGHTSRAGDDPVEWIRRAGPKLFDLHIKDMANLMDAKSECPVGDGAMPVVSIFDTLKSMNYQGGVMLEYELDPDNPLPGMIKSVAYMRGVLEGLAG